MSAYDNPRTTNDTTPWLREQKNNPDFIVFKNAYTSRVNTVLSLERALTEKNQYNSLEFRQSATIIDIAKKQATIQAGTAIKVLLTKQILL